MDVAGGMPQPLLPPQIALQNPELVGGHLFHVLPELERIVVLIDHDGDENYEPHLVPLAGGFPEPLAPEAFAGKRAHLVDVDVAEHTAYFHIELREESLQQSIRVDLESGVAEVLGESAYGAYPAAWTPDHGASCSRTRTRSATPSSTSSTRTARAASSTGRRSRSARRVASTRSSGSAGRTAPRAGRESCSARASSRTPGRRGYLDLARPGEIEPVAVEGPRARGRRRARGPRAPGGRPVRGDLQHRRLLLGLRDALRRARPAPAGRARPRRPGRARGRHPPRPALRRGERRVRALVLHRDRPDPALGARAGRERAPARGRPASARSASRPSSSPLARTRRSSRTTASASRRGSTSRHPSSGTRGRAPSCTTSTEARRARSGRTSPGSRCRSSSRSRSRASRSSCPTRAARPGTGSST